MLIFTLANERQRRTIQHASGPLEFGRGPEREIPRVVVEDRFTSRDQLLVKELPSGDVQVENLGSTVITVSDGTELNSQESRALVAPIRLNFGYTSLDIGVIPDEAPSLDSSMQSLSRMNRTVSPISIQSQLRDVGKSPSADTLAEWFARLLSVQRAAAGSGEFYLETARAVVELVGLDQGMVILRRGADWEVIAHHTPLSKRVPRYSSRVLSQVVTQRRTYFQSFADGGEMQSLAEVEAVVASPIFDAEDQVIGAVFGSRDLRMAAGPRGIQPLEAQFVQLLAGAVSAGLSRLESEAEAARARIQFEQFFSPELAEALARDPGVLAAQEREITILFADLRGFSRISERIGASTTYHLLSDILDRLTNQIMDHRGVVIDYYGDGLAAMWNAPTEVRNHAEMAVQAARAMQDEMPAINVTWAERLGGLIRLGIGINTGFSQVGNAGSKRRLKYGPRGHAVNLTSRVEAATKVLGVPCLVTEATHYVLPAKYETRRVCRARLTGMIGPVDLYELSPHDASSQWHGLKALYEQALLLYEQDNAAACLRVCRDMEERGYVGDVPTMLLAHKAEARLATPSAEFDPVYALETK